MEILDHNRNFERFQHDTFNIEFSMVIEISVENISLKILVYLFTSLFLPLRNILSVFPKFDTKRRILQDMILCLQLFERFKFDAQFRNKCAGRNHWDATVSATSGKQLQNQSFKVKRLKRNLKDLVTTFNAMCESVLNPRSSSKRKH